MPLPFYNGPMHDYRMDKGIAKAYPSFFSDHCRGHMADARTFFKRIPH